MRAIHLAVLALALASAASVFAQPTQRIRGDVTAVEGQKLTVRTRAGSIMPVDLDDKYTVSAVVRVPPDAIRTGSYVGAASMPQSDGTLRALEVLVFPESGRGSGEGHYPWDLQPGSMMTNATVAQVVGIDQGRRMTLKYKDGEQTILVPPDVPIVTFEPGSREMLVPGAHVILTATLRPDGSLAASRVAVGKDGLVPPMQTGAYASTSRRRRICAMCASRTCSKSSSSACSRIDAICIAECSRDTKTKSAPAS